MSAKEMTCWKTQRARPSRRGAPEKDVLDGRVARYVTEWVACTSWKPFGARRYSRAGEASANAPSAAEILLGQPPVGCCKNPDASDQECKPAGRHNGFGNRHFRQGCLRKLCNSAHRERRKRGLKTPYACGGDPPGDSAQFPGLASATGAIDRRPPTTGRVNDGGRPAHPIINIPQLYPPIDPPAIPTRAGCRASCEDY